MIISLVRGQPLLRGGRNIRHDEISDNTDYVNSAIAAQVIDHLDQGYSRTKPFTNAGFEESPSSTMPLDVSRNLDKDGAEVVRGNRPEFYSVVNKTPKGNFSLEQNNSVSQNNMENKHDSTYNRLHEKHGDKTDKVPVNVYNRTKNSDPLYDDTVSPSGKRVRNDVSSKVDHYHHKKNSP